MSRAMRRLAAGLAAAATAFAFSAAGADAGAARAALERAVAEAGAHAQTRYAFSASVIDEADPDAPPLHLRFDPRRPKGKRWSPLEGDERALGADARRRLKSLSQSDDADKSLTYAELAGSLAEAQLVSAVDGKAVFAAPLSDPQMPKAVRDSVDMQILVDVGRTYVERVEIVSRRPFKPAPVARVDSMVQTRSYAPLADGGPALLRLSRTDLTGEAMFKSINRRSRTEFFDFEAIKSDASGE
jgi:hypothetical protein